jgi:hypothetical protein
MTEVRQSKLDPYHHNVQSKFEFRGVMHSGIENHDAKSKTMMPNRKPSMPHQGPGLPSASENSIINSLPATIESSPV